LLAVWSLARNACRALSKLGTSKRDLGEVARPGQARLAVEVDRFTVKNGHPRWLLRYPLCACRERTFPTFKLPDCNRCSVEMDDPVVDDCLDVCDRLA